MGFGINDFQLIIDGFAKLPKKDATPTFMEICKYPYSRFEEVCSRVLQFYFDPKAGHKFGNLWLASLLHALNDSRFCDTEEVNVITEENADGKRVDLTIVSRDFVIGIENKTTADVYNPLDIYREYIRDTYKGKECKLLVLSVKPITDFWTRKKLIDCGFESLTYRDLFRAVRESLGGYIADCNQAYLTYMLDFMKTIDNMDDSSSRMENDFFFRHKGGIEELIVQFNAYKERILFVQREQISILRQRVSDATGCNWWAYQGWDLGLDFNEKWHRIGIESSYEADKNDPCAFFHIYVTTWDMKDWFPYKDIVQERFPEHVFLDEYNENRSYLHLPVISGNDPEKIVGALKRTFDIMVEIVSQIK